MSSETELTLELWEAFRDAIPASKREDTANKLIKALMNYGADIEELAADLHGEDAYLDRALDHYREPDEEDEIDYDDYDYDED